MKKFLFICLVVAVASCQSLLEKRVQLPSNHIVLNKDSDLKNKNGTWLWKGELFDGYIIEKEGHQIIAKLPIIDGKENGTAYGWFKNGKKKYERNYLNGNREGIHKGWYPNDSLAFEYQFHEDKYEGEQRSYYESGKSWQSLHYKNGYEEGKQKSWNESGRLINNFTVKKGKLYGVIGRFDCMSIHQKD